MRSYDARDEDAACDERPPAIGDDERRMHVRAYNFWMAALAGRAYPSIDDLDDRLAADFGPNAVLLDFREGGDPAIAHLGERLAHECGVAPSIRSLADVPTRSLLNRLTRQYRDIIANRAPIGFEAEFVDQRDVAMLYRGILMPFSSDGERIDFICGVVSWKTLADAAEADRIAMAAYAAMAPAAAPDPDAGDPAALDDGTLAGRLAAARQGAQRAEIARTGTRAAMFAALGLAHDLLIDAEADVDGFAAIMAEAGLVATATPRAIVSLVFGDGLGGERTRGLTDALAHARRLGVPRGGFVRHAEGLRGGVRAMIAAERRIHDAEARTRARALPTIAGLPDVPGEEEFVLLVARRRASGALAIVAAVPDESELIDRAIVRIAR